jgi:hypothetical protein
MPRTPYELRMRIAELAREIREKDARIRRLEATIHHMDRKSLHGCTDAYCRECDGPRCPVCKDEGIISDGGDSLQSCPACKED